MSPPEPPCSRRRYLRPRTILVFLLLAALGSNAVAFVLAWAMTHFETGAESTAHFRDRSDWDKVLCFCRNLSLPRPASPRDPPRWAREECTTLHYPGAGNADLETWRVAGKASQPKVLLFHGYAGCKISLQHAAHEFHNFGCETWMVDFHGSGNSAGHTTTVGYDEAEDVAATVRQALNSRAQNEPMILFGSSMGAAAVLCAVHRFHLQPDALILECPFDRLVTTIGNRCHMVGMPAFPAAEMMVFWGGVQGGFNGFTHNPVEYARDVSCPTLLMDGDQDERVGLSHAKEIAAALGAHCTFKVFTGAGHVMYADQVTQEWEGVVQDFLKSHHLLMQKTGLAVTEQPGGVE